MPLKGIVATLLVECPRPHGRRPHPRSRPPPRGGDEQLWGRSARVAIRGPGSL